MYIVYQIPPPKAKTTAVLNTTSKNLNLNLNLKV